MNPKKDNKPAWDHTTKKQKSPAKYFSIMDDDDE